MALTQVSGTTNLLGGTHAQENAVAEGKAVDEKPIVGKTFANKNKARAALGNISNRTGTISVASKPVVKPSVKEITTRSKAAAAQKLAKSQSEQVTECAKPKNVIQKVQERIPEERMSEPCPASPAPMDISSNNMSVSEDELLQSILPHNVKDIDTEDQRNPQLVAVYVNQIYAYMRYLERKTPIKQHYLDGTDLNGRMRGILVDWLVQVHLRFHLLQETLYITVAIIDRFLQVESVSRNKLQLVGVTAMLIACKYEEMYAPEIADFVYITDKAYTSSDIRKMEGIILKVLDFSFGRPIPLHFLRRDSKAGEVDAQEHTLAKYLMELTLVDYECVHLLPSQIAAAALCLSIKVLDSGPWDETLEHYSFFKEKELVPVMKRMAFLVTRAGTGKNTAIKAKYTSSKLMKISLLPELKSQVILDYAAGIAK